MVGCRESTVWLVLSLEVSNRLMVVSVLSMKKLEVRIFTQTEISFSISDSPRPLPISGVMRTSVYCRCEDEMVRERPDNPRSNAIAMKRKSLTLHLFGCLSQAILSSSSLSA